jgi:hypothetical protein
MKELAADGVVVHDTYVWRQGMSDWSMAGTVPELKAETALQSEVYPPAPPHGPPPMPGAPRSLAPVQQSAPSLSPATSWSYIHAHAPKSDKNRIAAGVLNIVVPGIGRLYLGYMAHGVLQLFVSIITCGIGYIWPLIDGIYILSGGLKLDGYGRRLED